MAKRARPVLRLLCWAVVCWIVVFWRLGYVGLIDDEAHYATLTREMMRHQSWLVPLLDGVPYIDKPVLFHWAQGLMVALFGDNEVAMRLPSAISTVALFGLTNWLGLRVFDRGIGMRAWLMLATIPATFILGRVAYLDMLFTAFTFGSVACVMVATLGERPRLQYAGFGLLALAVMTKGPVAIVLMACFLAAAWLAGGEARRAVRVLNWKTGFVLTVAASSPWFVWMYWRFGDEFVRGYFLSGHLAYLAPRSSASSFSHTFYLQMFFTAFFPWSLVTAGYAVDTLRRRWLGIRPPIGETLLWLWIGTVLVLFTVARFRVDRYIYPAAPACCLLAARAWVSAQASEGVKDVLATRVSILALAAVFAALGIALALNLPALALDIPPGAFVLPMALALGGIAVVVMMVRRQLRPPVVTAIPMVTMVTVYATVVVVGLSLIEQGRPIRQVGQWLQSQSAPGDSVGLYGLDRWEPSLRYYAIRPLHRLGDENDARAFLRSPGRGWLVMRKQEYNALRSSGEPAQIDFVVLAVLSTSGRGIRQQIWTEVVVIRKPE